MYFILIERRHHVFDPQSGRMVIPGPRFQSLIAPNGRPMKFRSRRKAAAHIDMIKARASYQALSEAPEYHIKGDE